MKWLVVIAIFFSCFGFAKNFEISHVQVTCMDRKICIAPQETFRSLKRNYVSINHFYEVFKLYVASEGIKELDFTLLEKNDAYSLEIKIWQKELILSISDPVLKGGSIEIPSILPIQVDTYLDDKKIKDTKQLLLDIAKDNGYPSASITSRLKRKSKGVEVSFEMNLGEPIVIQNVVINSKSNYVKDLILSRFDNYKNKPFSLQALKGELDELKKLFLEFGYYLSDFDIKYKFLENNKVDLYVEVKNISRSVFYFKNSNFFDDRDLKLELESAVTSGKRELTEDNVNTIILEKLEFAGFKFPKVKTRLKKSLDTKKDPIDYYFIEINEGARAVNKGIQFKGNSFFNQGDLKDFFNKVAPEQAKLGYYDPKFYKNFVGLLKEKYIKAGFVSVFVDKPLTQFNTDDGSEYTTFKIREGIRSQISSFSITGVDSELKNKLLEKLKSKVNIPFNPIAFKEDLTLIEEELKRLGYYFGKIKNLKESNLVFYKSDNASVEIEIEIDPGKQITANNIIIIGNRKTRKVLIKRELTFQKGDLVTSQALEGSQSNLLSLGIFSSVQIKPVTQDASNTDILIFVREKDFGLIEVAPGLRSDIGFKVSTSISYNNIDGMNKRVSFQGTVNRRFDLNALDDERRKSSKVMYEYDTSINYNENKILHSPVDFSMSVSKLRRRFFSYDADIQRFGYKLSYDYSNWFNIAARQQIEMISQFDATDETNHGQFQIGSITPSITLDFRNRPINPSSGALFDLSYERASPSVLSQNEDDLTIDYYKLISRNRFYVPFGDRVVLAMSATFGIQETLDDRGQNSSGESVVRIPNIKVFRLSGADLVRGFEDDEINRLISGEDISGVEVNRRAYLANLKFEPRYYLSDTTIFGLFYDAGRVFVNEFDSDELRSSAGLTFKYVTPVGTLDFDYGIKLLRKKDSSGTLETPGRLHVSIGFF